MTFLIMWLIYSLIKLVRSTENSLNKIVLSLDTLNQTVANTAHPKFIETPKKNRVVGKTDQQLAFEESRKLDRKK